MCKRLLSWSISSRTIFHLRRELKEKSVHQNKIHDLAIMRTAHSTAEKSLVGRERCHHFQYKTSRNWIGRADSNDLIPTDGKQPSYKYKGSRTWISLKDELERAKAECSKMRSVVAPTTSDSEITELKVWKKNAQDRIECTIVEDNIDSISTLEQRLQAT